MESVVALRLPFVNAYLVGKTDCVLVDSGPPGSAHRLLELMREAGKDPASVRLIVVTHAHADHYGSAAELRRLLGVPVACGLRDAGDLESGASRVGRPLGPAGRLALLASASQKLGRLRSRPLWALAPDVLFSGASSLARWGVDAAVVPAAGHTPGSVAVVPGAAMELEWDYDGREPSLPWAVAGDLCMGRFGAPARPRLPFFAVDKASLAASLRRFSGTALIHPGHGGPLLGADLAGLAQSRSLRKP